jgi:hypothetical protein
MGLVFTDIDARQHAERLARRHQERVEGGQPFGVVLDFLESNQIGERHHRLFGERGDHGAAQRRDMAETAKLAAEIARQRPHIGALAAFDLEHRVIGVGASQQRDAVDLDLAGGDLHHLAVRAMS